MTADAETARAWARMKLGVAPDDAADARSAFLRHLRACGFRPEPSALHAWEVLQDRPVSGGSDGGAFAARNEREAALRRRFEDLAASFFDHPAEARRSLFEDLRAAAAEFPHLADHLACLEAGLHLEPAWEEADDLQRDLLRKAAVLFVLHPRERAEKRRAFLADFAADEGAVGDAARALAERRPDLLLLDPNLFAAAVTLTRTPYPKPHPEVAPFPMQPAFGPTETSPLPPEILQQVPWRRESSEAEANAEQWRRDRRLLFLFLAIPIIVLLLFGAVGQTLRRNDSPPPIRPAPQIFRNWDPDNPFMRKKLDEQFEKLKNRLGIHIRVGEDGKLIVVPKPAAQPETKEK